MERYLLGLDNGGTYIKAALFDQTGRRIGVARRPNDVISLKPGYSEYNQEELWRINCACAKSVIETSKIDPGKIACIGIAGQGNGFYAIDKNGNDIRNAISSADRRATPQAERWLKDGTGDRMYPRIFRQTFPGHPNAILAWMKENEPENYYAIHRFFTMKDYLVYRLTGNVVAGLGCQSSSGLMDLNTRAFEPDIAEAFGIGEMDGKYGELVQDTHVCGGVTEEAAKQFGCVPGTKVCAGLHDVVSCAIAMGITDSKPLFMILGTHGINGYISPAPILDGSIKYNEIFAIPDMYLIEEGYPSSSATLEWAIDALIPEKRKQGNVYDTVNEMVSSVAPTDDCPVFLPFLRGQRDNARALGTWIGLKSEHGACHMLRAVYEGVVFTHMCQIEHLLANREKPDRIRVAGGATASDVWMRMFADALEIPIETVPSEEMGAKGAAIASAVAAGIYPDLAKAVAAMTSQGAVIFPRGENSQVYKKKFSRYKACVSALDGLWENI